VGHVSIGACILCVHQMLDVLSSHTVPGLLSPGSLTALCTSAQLSCWGLHAPSRARLFIPYNCHTIMPCL
jgi:hypothetical protein